MSRMYGTVIRGYESLGLRLEMHLRGPQTKRRDYTVMYSPEGKWENNVGDGVFPLFFTRSSSCAYAALESCAEILRRSPGQAVKSWDDSAKHLLLLFSTVFRATCEEFPDIRVSEVLVRTLETITAMDDIAAGRDTSQGEHVTYRATYGAIQRLLVQAEELAAKQGRAGYGAKEGKS